MKFTPYVMIMRPAQYMRGPSSTPSLMASRTPTSVNQVPPGTEMLVTPDRSTFWALHAALSTPSSGLIVPRPRPSPRSCGYPYERCVWASISPGMIHCPEASMTSTSVRVLSNRRDSGSRPMLRMRLPSTTSASFGVGARPEPSIIVPLRMTSMRSPVAGLDTDHDLEGVVDPLRVRMERLVNLVELEVVGDDRVGQDLARAHERQRAPAVHPALSARCIDPHVGTDSEVHVDLDRATVPGDHPDAPTALHVLERLLHRGGSAGALEHAIGAAAARDLAHALGEVFLADVDREVRAQPLADREPRVASARENDARCAKGLAKLDGDEPDGARALDEHRLARDVSTHQVDGPEGRGGCRHHAGLLEAQVFRQPVEGVDVVDRVLGEPAVAGEALRAVALRDVAVVQAGGVPALDAVVAAVTALVHLHRHPIAHPELVYAGAQADDGAGVLVAHHEGAGGLAHEGAVQHLHVGAADRRDLDLQQRLARSRLGSWPGLDVHVVGAVEDHGLHRGGRRHKLLPPAGTATGASTLA